MKHYQNNRYQKNNEASYEGVYKAINLFHEYSLKKQDEIKKVLINRRALTEDTIKEFGFGAIEKEDRDRLDELFEMYGIDPFDIFRAGLQSKKDNYIWYRFENRIIIPIHNPPGTRIIGFAGWNPTSKQKYINSPTSQVFEKKKILFNYHRAKPYIEEKGFAVVVEGYFDAISLYQRGIKNVVATGGTSYTKHHDTLLKEITENILFVFDGDFAGRKATERALKIAEKAYYVELPNGADPDDFIKSIPTDKIEASLESFCGLEVKYYEEQKKLTKKERKKRLFNAVIGLYGEEYDVVTRLGQIYVIPLKEPGVCYLVGSSGYKAFFVDIIVNKLKESPNDNIFKELELYLIYLARKKKDDNYVIGQKRSVYDNGAIYIYLGSDHKGKAVKIDDGGYGIVNIPEHIRFVDVDTRYSFPLPEGNEIRYLEDLVCNRLPLGHQVDGLLTISWLIHSILPVKERPFLFLTGPQGTGKTTTAKIISKLIDNDPTNTCLLHGQKVHDLTLNLSRQQAVIFDNLSGISTEIANVLSTVTQGASLTVRKLYTTKGTESIQIDPHLSIIITSIGDTISRLPDFMERLLRISLDYPKEENGGNPNYYLDRNYSKILGGLYTLVSLVISNRRVKAQLEWYAAHYSRNPASAHTGGLGDLDWLSQENGCDTSCATPETLDNKGNSKVDDLVAQRNAIIKMFEEREKREGRFSLLWTISKEVMLGGWLSHLRHYRLASDFLEVLEGTAFHDALALYNDPAYIALDKFLRSNYINRWEGFLSDLYLELKEKFPDIFGRLRPQDLGNRLASWRKFSSETGWVIEPVGRKMENGRRGYKYIIYRKDEDKLVEECKKEDSLAELKEVIIEEVKAVEAELMERRIFEVNDENCRLAARLLHNRLKQRKFKGIPLPKYLADNVEGVLFIDRVEGMSPNWTSGPTYGRNIIGSHIVPALHRYYIEAWSSQSKNQ